MKTTPSIYAAAHDLIEKRRRHERFLDWGIGQFIKFAMPLVKKMLRDKVATESIYVRAWYMSRGIQ